VYAEELAADFEIVGLLNLVSVSAARNARATLRSARGGDFPGVRVEIAGRDICRLVHHWKASGTLA
jgi:hypothetical protein